MSERGVSIRLQANVNQYVASMRAAQASTTQFSNTTVGNLKKVGGDMQKVGGMLTKSVSLPLAAAGGFATKMAMDFDNAFTRMQSLAGVSAAEIDDLKASVLDLSGATGRAPEELANGLYFLRSSGLDASQAMDALEQSARASAAGLGSTATIADAVSSAMNAYATSGLSAAEATDVLTATARAGKAEPEQLAGALGKVLPVASELGITFQDVGGAIAALSLSGNDAATSATLLSNIMSKLLKPSQQGAAALKEVGMSAASIRASIADEGLLGTLEMLKARLGDAGFVKFMEDAQAVQGALALTGQNAEKVNEVFGQVKDSVGATSEAFETAAGSDGFKLQQSFNDLKVAMIQAGDVIMPIVAGVAGAIGDLAGAFSEMSPAGQKVVLGFLAIVAAAGPLVSIGGKLVSNLGLISSGLQKVGVSATAAKTGLGLASVALIAYTANAMHANKEQNQFTDLLAQFNTMTAVQQLEHLNELLVAGSFVNKSFGETFLELARTYNGAAMSLNEYMLAQIAAGTADADMIAQQKLLAGALQQASNENAIAVENAKRAAAATEEQVTATDQAAEATRFLTYEQREGSEVADEGAGAVGRQAKAMEELGDQARDTREAILDYKDALLEAMFGLFDTEKAQMALADSSAAYAQKLNEVILMEAEGKKGTDEWHASMRDLRETEIGSAEDALKYAMSVHGVTDAHNLSQSKAQAMILTLIDMKNQYPFLSEEIDGYIGTLGKVPPKVPTKAEFLKDLATLSADELKLKYTSIQDKIPTDAEFIKDAATMDADELMEKYGTIPKDKHTTGHFEKSDAMSAIGSLTSALFGIPKDTYTTHHVNTVTSHTELNEGNQGAPGGTSAMFGGLTSFSELSGASWTPAASYNHGASASDIGAALASALTKGNARGVTVNNYSRPATASVVAQAIRAAELMQADGIMVNA